jgi:expansin (peptidoglycan-binding protein)
VRAVVVGAGVVAGVAALVVPLSPGPTTGAAEIVPGDGIATNYDSVDGGNCSFTGPPGDRLDTALSEVEYGTADGCGAYLDVTGPNGTVRVKVTNRCPECPVGHLDLSRTAFARIAPLEAGRVDVSYTIVRNPPVEPLTLRVKQGSSRWWMQVQVDHHGNPLARVELQTPDGWRSLPRSQDNFWTAEDPGPGDGPFTLRITDVLGQSATVEGVDLAVDVVQSTGARLYGAGDAPPGPPPTDAPPPTAPPTTTTTPATTTTTAAPTTTTTSSVAMAGDGAGDDPSHREAEPAAARSSSGGGGSTELLLAGGAAVLAAAGAAVVAARRRQPSGAIEPSMSQPASNSAK